VEVLGVLLLVGGVAGDRAAVIPAGTSSGPAALLTGAATTSYDFSIPCKAHDLGYDLLRYAAKTLVAGWNAWMTQRERHGGKVA
jgi:hypothetical protein